MGTPFLIDQFQGDFCLVFTEHFNFLCIDAEFFSDFCDGAKFYFLGDVQVIHVFLILYKNSNKGKIAS